MISKQRLEQSEKKNAEIPDLPWVSVFGVFSQVHILVLPAVWEAVVEQRDRPQAGQTQQPEAQQNQLHAQAKVWTFSFPSEPSDRVAVFQRRSAWS